MNKQISIAVFWVCRSAILVFALGGIYLLIDIELFVHLAQLSFNLPIQWHTVDSTQWYSLWLFAMSYLLIGLFGLYYLSKAFKNFASGEFFNLTNSTYLKRFSILLFAQSVVTPIHFALSSILLSLNHPTGQKLLSIALSSHELKGIILAMIFWVLSNILVESAQLQSENQQFI